MIERFLDDVKWDEKGLVGAIAQDHESGEVLMFAWMNRESLRLTLEEGAAVYWSRSRNKLWRKGDTSGHRQRVLNVAIDCDRDCLLLKIEQTGAACHEGFRSCFYRDVSPAGELTENSVRVA